ncbi:MAG: M15 family metallopeptidase [Bacteroidetes bacterium]|nr:M15 family metallopeptidase [Bacteroidota bacterium]MCB0844087.1 M15 family metallopeptidase [Bacteroidota bacterium]
MNYFSCLLVVWMLSFSLLGFGCQENGKGEHSTEETLSGDSLMADSLVMSEPTPDSVAVSYLLGRFDPEKDTNFVKIEDKHSEGSGRGAYLHRETYEAFKKMYEAAKADGVQLVIRSATRNFYRQKEIWEGKWTGSTKVGGKDLSKSTPDPEERALTILLYSSMPGTSRHHWGTDMDLNAFENDYFKSGKGLKEYQWLTENAHKFGFCQPYTEKGENRPNGYEEERWHWSYVPLAKKYLDAYGNQVSMEMIEGFKGAEVAGPIGVIEKYVFGINEACK